MTPAPDKPPPGSSPCTGPRNPCAGSGALPLPLPAGAVPYAGVPPPPAHSSSACLAVASIAASDLRTWLRSVVVQKSGSDAFRYDP